MEGDVGIRRVSHSSKGGSSGPVWTMFDHVRPCSIPKACEALRLQNIVQNAERRGWFYAEDEACQIDVLALQDLNTN